MWNYQAAVSIYYLFYEYTLNIELTRGRLVLSMLQVVTNLILTTALLTVSAHPHFTGEETEARKGHTPSFCN